MNFDNMNEDNQQEKNSLADSAVDMEKILDSVKLLSVFHWVNNSDQDQFLYVRLFKPGNSEPFEHTYHLIPGITSWFTLTTGTAYFYYNTQPLLPLELIDNKTTYYIIIHKDGKIQCGSEKE